MRKPKRRKPSSKFFQSTKQSVRNNRIKPLLERTFETKYKKNIPIPLTFQNTKSNKSKKKKHVETEAAENKNKIANSLKNEKERNKAVN